MLSKKIQIIKDSLLPTELDMLEVTNVVQESSEYYNKYSTMAINSHIGMVATYKGKEVQINFFDGIGYRDDSHKTKLVVTKFPNENNIGMLDDGFYYWESDSCEVCQEIATLLNGYCFGDEAYDGLFDDNCEFIHDTISELNTAEFILITATIPIDVTKREVLSVQRLAKASREASAGFLYQVFVICNNVLEGLYQNLTKEEAEQLYVELANKWYRYDDKFSNVEGIQEYKSSEEYLDNADMANVVMERMI